MVMLTLIPFAPEHFALLSGWFRTEAEVVQWGGPLARFPLSHDQLQGLLHQGIANPPARLCWMAEKDAALIGHAQLSFDWRNGNAKLCRVGIAPEARGQRLAAPMLRLVIEKAFAFPDIARLELNVYTRNAAAMRTYEGLGFELEGVRRSSVLVGDERWDTAMMAMLRNNLTT